MPDATVHAFYKAIFEFREFLFINSSRLLLIEYSSFQHSAQLDFGLLESNLKLLTSVTDFKLLQVTDSNSSARSSMIESMAIRNIL